MCERSHECGRADSSKPESSLSSLSLPLSLTFRILFINHINKHNTKLLGSTEKRPLERVKERVFLHTCTIKSILLVEVMHW